MFSLASLMQLPSLPFLPLHGSSTQIALEDGLTT